MPGLSQRGSLFWSMFAKAVVEAVAIVLLGTEETEVFEFLVASEYVAGSSRLPWLSRGATVNPPWLGGGGAELMVPCEAKP